jgi:hypothetical protein
LRLDNRVTLANSFSYHMRQLDGVLFKRAISVALTQSTCSSMTETIGANGLELFACYNVVKRPDKRRTADRTVEYFFSPMRAMTVRRFQGLRPHAPAPHLVVQAAINTLFHTISSPWAISTPLIIGIS